MGNKTTHVFIPINSQPSGEAVCFALGAGIRFNITGFFAVFLGHLRAFWCDDAF
jgi:hypothetical protein